YFGRSTFMAKRIIKQAPPSFGRRLMSRLMKQGNTKVNCDQCHKPSNKRLCPRCHNQLPTFFHQEQSHIISIIGARNSGKTHYITVLINELLRRGHLLKISTIPQDVGEDRREVTSIRYKRDYKGPLLDQQQELVQTQASKDLYPLIYEIASSGEQSFGKKRVLYLAFYDTAGENFRDDEEIRKMANYVSNSSGVIFLLDTFQIPIVKKHLKGKGLQIPDLSTDYHDVLYKVLNRFGREGHITQAGRKNKIPTAITLSKFDEVLRHNLLSDHLGKSSINNNSSYLQRRKYNEQEIADFSAVIKYNLEEQWHESGFVSDISTRFSNCHFFGVSALGHTPVKGKLVDGQYVPFRVMDPLLWILDQLNFVLPK
ncbi:MAG: hypothetical protein AAFP19_23315, partial [Bacteroidota bacterium]